MLLHTTDKLPFGKYRGINLGLIYLLTPSYIEWMMMGTSYCVGDIDFLQSLKVIDRFGTHSPMAHHAEVDREEYEDLWSGKVEFEDVKFSGYKTFSFCNQAISKNAEKLSRYSSSISKRQIIPEEEREVLIFYPGTLNRSENAMFTPTGVNINSKGRTVLSFEVDNSSRVISFLPNKKNLKVSSFFWPEWKMTPELLEKLFEEKRPIRGKIREGQLLLEK